MFVEVTLKNFRQHRDLTVQFGPGLNAIRGRNEAGKTTIIEAILYALFGARCLREPLENVVSWGEDPRTLRVTLRFQTGTGIHRVERHKGGATLTSELAGLVASGQSPVTLACEELIGAKADAAQRMMMASQKALQGALEEGPGAAVKLIEQLANFSLIDKIIATAQEKLPTGRTESVKDRIALLEGQLGDEPADPTPPLAVFLTNVQRAAAQAAEAEKLAREAVAAAEPGARDAQVVLNEYSKLEGRLEQSKQRVVTLTAALAAIHPVPGPSEEEIAELRAQVEDADRLTRARAAWDFVQRTQPVVEVKSSRAEIEAAEREGRDKERRLVQRMHVIEMEASKLEARIIKDKSCAFCGKDLTDVPEVTTHNDALSQQLAEKRDAVNRKRLEIDELHRELGKLDTLLRDDARLTAAASSHAEFIQFDTGYIPARLQYRGPDVANGHGDVRPEEARALLRQAEAKVRAYQQELGRQSQAQTALNQALEATTALRAEYEAAKEAVPLAEGTLQRYSVLSQEFCSAQFKLGTLEQNVKDQKAKLDNERRLFEQAKRHWQQLKDQLDAAQKEFRDMSRANALIAKLRAARPAIADQLWGSLTAAVSQQFSAIRGTPSVVAREANDFTVDGRSIGGLSGSTLDALGLSIRVGLTKTFLPSTSFMTLDEPAAACDEERELNMLGMIAACGFDQVLLVTHSDQCESFADNVVRLQ